MSARHRTIAAAPARSAQQAWAVISQLVVETLAKSTDIDGPAVAKELAAIAPAAVVLIASGHLEKTPLVLDAPPLNLEISIVSGNDALELEENLRPVPGAATATAWTMALPTPAPFTAMIEAALAPHPHLFGATDNKKAARGATEAVGDLIDLEAFRNAGRENK